MDSSSLYISSSEEERKKAAQKIKHNVKFIWGCVEKRERFTFIVWGNHVRCWADDREKWEYVFFRTPQILSLSAALTAAENEK